MDGFFPLRFLFGLVQAYAEPTVVIGASNFGVAVVLHAVLPKRRIRLLPRILALVGAGLVSGPIGVAEAVATVASHGWIEEAAGLALVSLPFLFAPTTAASLIWLVRESVGGSKRPARAFLGAIAGALTVSPLLVLFEHVSARTLPSVYQLYLLWTFLGLPLAAGATLGHLVASRP